MLCWYVGATSKSSCYEEAINGGVDIFGTFNTAVCCYSKKTPADAGVFCRGLFKFDSIVVFTTVHCVVCDNECAGAVV